MRPRDIRGAVILAALMHAALLGCKSTDPGAQTASATGADAAPPAESGSGLPTTVPGAPGPLDFTDRGPDLPPEGRSLFDYLVAKPSAPGGFDIPYPFERFVALIEAQGNYVAGTLIPRGRSLQRNANAPDYFKFPRVVITPIGLLRAADAPADGATAGMHLQQELFIGYSEPAKQMEVISFNAKLGRFEFQLVTGYGDGTTPRISYARRAICTSCHQAQGPIFPEQEWVETNANAIVAIEIAKEHGDSPSYHGIPHGDIKLDPAFKKRIPVDATSGGVEHARSRTYTIDRSVRRGHLLNLFREYWIYGCGGASPDGAWCRATVAKRTFAIPGTSPVSATPAFPVEEKFADFWKARYPHGLQAPTSAIKSLEDFVTQAESIFDLPDPEDTAKSLNFLKTFQSKEAFDPLTRRASVSDVALEFVGDDAESLRFAASAAISAVDRQLVLLASGNDYAKVYAAIDALLARTNAGQSRVFGPHPFNRSDFLDEMLAQLGWPHPAGACCDNAPAPSFPAQSELQDQGDAETAGDPRLTNFKRYCSGCHGEDGVAPTFMAGADGAVIASIKALGTRIADRLDYGRIPPPPKPMPPSNSAPGKALRNPEHDNQRQEMLVILSQLAQGAP